MFQIFNWENRHLFTGDALGFRNNSDAFELTFDFFACGSETGVTSVATSGLLRVNSHVKPFCLSDNKTVGRRGRTEQTQLEVIFSFSDYMILLGWKFKKILSTLIALKQFRLIIDREIYSGHNLVNFDLKENRI